MAYIITVKGDKIPLELMKFPQCESKLEILQDAVGGFIEVINMGRKVMIVNEEGALQHLPVNQLATLLLQTQSRFPINPILGDVVIADKSEID